jgi:hypothetical protein
LNGSETGPRQCRWKSGKVFPDLPKRGHGVADGQC